MSSPRNTIASAHIAVLSANIIYGINYAVAKGIMPDYMEPRAIIFVRVAGSFILFLLFALLFIRERPQKKDLPLIFLCSVFGITINQIMFFEGLNLTTSINTSIIMTINPILVMVFASFMLKEKITFLKMAGIILGMAGAAWLILQKGDLSFQSSTFTGNVFIVINAASFALYLVLAKPLMMKYHPVTVMTWIFGTGLITVTPLCFGTFIRTDFAAMPTNVWISLTYIVVFATFLGYLLYNIAIRHLSPTSTSSYIYLQPLFAGIVGYILLAEQPGWVHLFASLLIVAGVYLVSIRKGTSLKNGS
jgi:drug/metabolite transporter (DMT)-like permease